MAELASETHTPKKDTILNRTASQLNSLPGWVPAAALAVILSLTASAAFAQDAGVPAAPAPQAPAAQSPAAAPPSAPAPAPAAPVDPLPPVNPRFFTAPTPTVATVNSFLNQVWGSDTNRLWRVEGIQTTSAPGVVKVTVFITTKDPKAQLQAATFFVTPDGKHAIGEGAGGVVPFGATPFADTRDLLKQRANGAWRGAPGKDLELVEFADLQCPHCKEVQSVMDDIVKDFPKAHVVFQLFPLVEIHSSAFKAAAYGVCAQKQSNDGFFKFAAGVFETQEGLSPTTDDTVLKAAAMRAGLNAEAIAACAATQATKDIVNADIKLAEDAGVEQTPMLSANGRLLPISGVSYEAIKQLIQFQATLDGVDSGATAETLAPKPEQPKLTDLPK
ncbi:MAG: DsbA family protein [Acidobacteriaceae bacterium]|jgi:protein-disulfide isomerase